MENIILKTVLKFKTLLPNRFRRKGIVAVILLLLNSILELVGLASIIPLFTVIIKDGAVQQNLYLKYVYDLFGFTSENNFIISVTACVVLIILFLELGYKFHLHILSHPSTSCILLSAGKINLSPLNIILLSDSSVDFIFDNIVSSIFCLNDILSI